MIHGLTFPSMMWKRPWWLEILLWPRILAFSILIRASVPERRGSPQVSLLGIRISHYLPSRMCDSYLLSPQKLMWQSTFLFLLLKDLGSILGRCYRLNLEDLTSLSGFWRVIWHCLCSPWIPAGEITCLKGIGTTNVRVVNWSLRSNPDSPHTVWLLWRGMHLETFVRVNRANQRHVGETWQICNEVWVPEVVATISLSDFANGGVGSGYNLERSVFPSFS